MDKRVIPNDVLLPEVAKFLEEGREVVLSPKGNSMLPFIREGKDSVILKKLPTEEVGDIVLAKLPGRYVLHRIVDEDSNRLTLMGDGNLRGTESCTRDDVLGSVIYIVRGGKRKVKPGKGMWWRALMPFRRIILGIYRRLI